MQQKPGIRQVGNSILECCALTPMTGEIKVDAKRCRVCANKPAIEVRKPSHYISIM